MLIVARLIAHCADAYRLHMKKTAPSHTGRAIIFNYYLFRDQITTGTSSKASNPPPKANTS